MSYLKSNDLFAHTEPENLYSRIPRPMVIADHTSACISKAPMTKAT